MAAKSSRKMTFWVLLMAAVIAVASGAIALINQPEPVPMAPGPSYYNEAPEEVL